MLLNSRSLRNKVDKLITGKIKNLIIKRNRAFRNIDKERYRLLRNKVTNEIRKEYFIMRK